MENRVKLANVKWQLYHPCPPTLRRISMDTQRCLLSHEHCQTSTLTTRRDNLRTTFYNYHPAAYYFDGFEVLPTVYKHALPICGQPELYPPVMSSWLKDPMFRAKWELFKNGIPLTEKCGVEMPDYRRLHFNGYCVRFLQPQVTSSWRHYVKHGPETKPPC